MNNKKIIIYIVEIVAGIIIELLAFSGLVSDPSVMSSIGSAILAVGLVMLIREMRMERDPELKKRVETASRDERYAFISMKAKEAAFGIYTIIAGVLCLVCLALGYREEGTFAAMSISLLAILYAIMFHVMARKY